MQFESQYKHPKWQKKRLEALDAHGFLCQRCESEENTLHVHHKAYVKGRKVWDYSVNELTVLCDKCHKIEHAEKDILNEVFLRSSVTPLECAALLFGFVGASAHQDDDIEHGLKTYDPSLFLIGEFSRNCTDFDPKDIKTVLSLSPDDFHAIAEYARSSNG